MRVLVLIVIPAAAMAVGFQTSAAIAGAVGGEIGVMVGENLAPAILIGLSKVGLVDEDELFSPFSTFLYDSIEEGKILGAVLGTELAEFVAGRRSLGDFLVESILSYATLKVMSYVFEGWLRDFVLYPAACGLIAGVEW